MLNKKSKLMVLCAIFLLIFTVNLNIISIFWSNHSRSNSFQEDLRDDPPILKTNDVSEDNEFTGIGAPWNITHYANRTEEDITVNFEEGSSDIAEIPLYYGWEGYKLKANLTNIYDSRNWVNGTFHEGNDDGVGTCPENDSDDVLNWTFNEFDGGSYNNDMSGNYNDSIDNHDALELRMNGNYHLLNESDRYRYDENDECSWFTNINIPRGKIISSTFKFQVNPFYVANFNSWEVVIKINDIRIYSYGLYDLKDAGEGQWQNYTIAQSRWLNTSNIFPSGPINGTNVKVEVVLLHSSTDASYGPEDGENIEYQQIFIDNVELITRAEAYPSDLDLKLNNKYVNDLDWGVGYLDIFATGNNWLPDSSNKTYFNFQTEDVSILGNYDIDLKADLNLFALKNTPESNYETNEKALGTNFIITNASSAEWATYCYVEVPEKYIESEVTISFPSDIDITHVYDPQNPSVNILDQCDNSTPGFLNIPLKTISQTPDGFWELNARSPNYCDDLILYNNATGSWEKPSEFLAGQYLNITAKIDDTAITSGYLDKTHASAILRFPNGSLWTDNIKISSVNTNGNVYFEPILIPTSSINYVAGEYEVLVKWNNSYNDFSFNETGFIYKKINILHESFLEPEKTYYEDNFKDSIINLRVSFYDLIDNKSIENADVYTYNFINPSTENYFSEINPGFYLLEFNVSGGIIGNNNITIYANSTFFVNQQIDITIEIINETNLLVDNDFISDAQFNQNFTIQFNYSDLSTGIGVDTSDILINWKADYSIQSLAQGIYLLTANASSMQYEAGELYNLTIVITKIGYETQSKLINVFITEVSSYLELEIDGNVVESNDILTVNVRDQLNITAFYKDINNNSINGANIYIQGSDFSEDLTEIPSLNQYYLNLNATALGQGIDNLIVYAERTNYKPSSIPFVVEIIEVESKIEIFFDGVNKTIDPTTEVPIGTQINITVKYSDTLFNQYIKGATISLEGDISGTFLEEQDLEQYYYILNTSNLDVGLRILELKALRNNFETQTKNIRIQVEKIPTQINFTQGSSIINLRPGEYTTIAISLKNLVNNESILGASINYTWVFGSGVFEDENNDGIYTASIGGALDGSYTLIVNPSLNENYDFQSFDITITVSRSMAEVISVQVGSTLAIISALLIGGYLLLYLTILKYPKQVRKVRKYRKSLKKENPPSIDIQNRKRGFIERYKTELSRTSKLKKEHPDFSKSKEAEGFKSKKGGGINQ
ncbi:MAG: hypothetical protein ACQERB_15175 [Promethearchaeati archaeon]